MSSLTRPPQPGIRLHVDLGRDLRPHRSAKIEAHLRVDVSADGAPTDLPAVQLAVVLAVDVAEANRGAVRHALPAALRALPDRISFAVLGGGPEPVRCYPRGGEEWAVADQDERRRAAFVTGSLPLHRDGPRPAGYAAWVARAHALLAGRPASVRHLVLITDGSSAAGESRLEEQLEACAGEFTCDVFAVGTDWSPDPLLALAERLHGTAEFVDEGLGRAITDAIGRLRRVHTPRLPIDVTVRPCVRQVSLSEKAPRPHRLGGLPQPGRPHRWSFPTYQWEQGRRDYLLTLVADSGADPLETELLFALVSIGDFHAAVTARWHLPGSPSPTSRRAPTACASSTPPPGCAVPCAAASPPCATTGRPPPRTAWGRPPGWRPGSARTGCWTRSARSPTSRTRPRGGCGRAPSTPAPSAR